jgi:hypothetical protein
MRTSFHHQPEAQHPKSPAIETPAGRLPHLWEEMTTKYGLKSVMYTDLVAWPFADYVFGADWDIMSDVTKSRLYGFQEVVDSEAMFMRLLRRFREERIVP